jgi:hypothetical protein
MPQALIHLGEREDRILTIIKGKYGLKNKSDAVNHLIQQYEEELLEPELRPEFVKKMRKIEKEKPIVIGTVDDLRKRYS